MLIIPPPKLFRMEKNRIYASSPQNFSRIKREFNGSSSRCIRFSRLLLPYSSSFLLFFFSNHTATISVKKSKASHKVIGKLRKKSTSIPPPVAPSASPSLVSSPSFEMLPGFEEGIGKEQWKKEQKLVDVVEWRRGKNVVFSVWDFPSGESLTNRFYITDRSMYVVCFDCTKPNPSRIEHWLKLVKATTIDRPPIILVGTRADLLSEEAYDRLFSDLQRRFSHIRFPNLKVFFLFYLLSNSSCCLSISLLFILALSFREFILSPLSLHLE